jgi:hypothetical protein
VTAESDRWGIKTTNIKQQPGHVHSDVFARANSNIRLASSIPLGQARKIVKRVFLSWFVLVVFLCVDGVNVLVYILAFFAGTARNNTVCWCSENQDELKQQKKRTRLSGAVSSDLTACTLHIPNNPHTTSLFFQNNNVHKPTLYVCAGAFIVGFTVPKPSLEIDMIRA